MVDPVQHEELAGDDIRNDVPEVVCESPEVEPLDPVQLVRDDKGNDVPEVVCDPSEAEVVDEGQMVDGRPGYIELIVHVWGKGGAEFE